MNFNIGSQKAGRNIVNVGSDIKVGRFERKKLEELRFKVGDKIMGYHRGLGMNTLVAGTITKAEQEVSVFSENSYEVELEKEFELHEGAKFHLQENEAVKFDKEQFLIALEHFSKSGIYNQKSYEEHQLMIKAVYQTKLPYELR